MPRRIPTTVVGLGAGEPGQGRLHGPFGFFVASTDTIWTPMALQALITDFVRTPEGTLVVGTSGIWSEVYQREFGCSWLCLCGYAVG